MQDYLLYKEQILSNKKTDDDRITAYFAKIHLKQNFKSLNMNQINDLYLSVPKERDFFFKDKTKEIDTLILKKAVSAGVKFPGFLNFKKKDVHTNEYFRLLDPDCDGEIIRRYILEGYPEIHNYLAEYYVKKQKVSPYFIEAKDECFIEYILFLDKEKNIKEIKKYLSTDYKNTIVKSERNTEYSKELKGFIIEKNNQNIFEFDLTVQQIREYIYQPYFSIDIGFANELRFEESINCEIKNEVYSHALDKCLKKMELIDLMPSCSLDLFNYILENKEKYQLRDHFSKKYELVLEKNIDEETTKMISYRVNGLQKVIYNLSDPYQYHKNKENIIKKLTHEYEDLLLEPTERLFYLNCFVKDFTEILIENNIFSTFFHCDNEKYKSIRKSVILEKFINSYTCDESMDFTDFSYEQLELIAQNYNLTQEKQNYLNIFKEKAKMHKEIPKIENNKSIYKI